MKYITKSAVKGHLSHRNQMESTLDITVSTFSCFKKKPSLLQLKLPYMIEIRCAMAVPFILKPWKNPCLYDLPSRPFRPRFIKTFRKLSPTETGPQKKVPACFFKHCLSPGIWSIFSKTSARQNPRDVQHL